MYNKLFKTTVFSVCIALGSFAQAGVNVNEATTCGAAAYYVANNTSDPETKELASSLVLRFLNEVRGKVSRRDYIETVATKHHVFQLVETYENAEVVDNVVTEIMRECVAALSDNRS